MGANKVSNATVVTNNTKRILALNKHVTGKKPEIPIGGRVLKPAQVTAVFQDSLDKRAAITAALAAYKAALAAGVEAEANRRVAEAALKAWVLNRFGADSTEAHEFGYTARKTAVLSAVDRANAVLLNQATRKARGTMGKKEKLKIKGTLSAPTTPAVPPGGGGSA